MPREVLAGMLLLAACLDASREIKEEASGSRLVADWLSAFLSPRVLPFYAALIGLAWTGLMLARPSRVQSSSLAGSSLCGGECGSHAGKTGGSGCVGCGSRQMPSQAPRTAVSIPVPSSTVRSSQPFPPVLQAKMPPVSKQPPDSASSATSNLNQPVPTLPVPKTKSVPVTPAELQKDGNP